MIIDAHHHVWDPATGGYGWLDEAPPILRRRYGFEELAPQLSRHQVDGTVLVQAADSDQDTDAMFAVAAEQPKILGVVGYVSLHEPDQAAQRLTTLLTRDRFVGVRNLIHDQPDPDWLRRDDVAEGLALLEAQDVSFDLVTSRPEHLAQIGYLSGRFPRLRIVIDHLGKPPIGTDPADPPGLAWAEQIRIAAANPLVTVKVSGLYPPQHPHDGAPVTSGAEALRPWIDQAVASFGPDRLMFGSDWPVAETAGGYSAVTQALTTVLRGYGSEILAAVMGETAVAAYRLAR